MKNNMLFDIDNLLKLLSISFLAVGLAAHHQNFGMEVSMQDKEAPGRRSECARTFLPRKQFATSLEPEFQEHVICTQRKFRTWTSFLVVLK